MNCLHPITLPISRINRETGELSESEPITVPCGKCPACRSNYRSEWTLRLWHEAKSSVHSNYFVTLTYEDSHMPLHMSVDGLNPCFSKRDCQLFIKRLRRHFHSHQFRFYLVCEYGSTTYRPHYHALIFNVPADLEKFRKIVHDKWDLGRVSVDVVTDQRIGYCTKYCLKEIDTFLEDHPRSDPRVPFALMSKGIGRGFMEKQVNQYQFEPSNVVVNPMSGKKTVLPRYYKSKLFNDDDKEFLAEQGKLYYSLRSHPDVDNSDYHLDKLLDERSRSLHRHKSKI